MIKICSKCIFDSTISNIVFDDKGVCNYCHQIDDLNVEYATGKPKGEEKLNAILSSLREKGKGKKYDCIIGVSGGTDSSYMLLKCKEWGVRPLAVHYDNTWNSSIASENIRKVTRKLNIDLYTYVIDNKEADDIFTSFLLAGVPEFDASTDMAFAQVLRKAAAKFKVNYILEGHSFIAEGLSPQGKNYFDGKYVQSIHKKYGKLKMKTYPLMTFFQFMKWTLIYKQQFIRPLWYIDYSKADAIKLLQEETDWEYYGGHHLENRSTAFLHKVYNPQKFDIDNRNWTLAADVRAGRMSRESALEIYSSPIPDDQDLIEYVQKRLKLSPEEYQRIMSIPKKSFRDYKTYKKRFEFFRPVFKILSNLNLVPKSFYLKYCFPLKED